MEKNIEALLQDCTHISGLYVDVYRDHPTVRDIEDHLAESLDAAEGAQYEALMDIVVELLLTHESSDCRHIAIAATFASAIARS